MFNDDVKSNIFPIDWEKESNNLGLNTGQNTNILPFSSGQVTEQVAYSQIAGIYKGLLDTYGIPLQHAEKEVKKRLGNGTEQAPYGEWVNLGDYLLSEPERRGQKEDEVQKEEIFERYALFKGDRPAILVSQSGIGKSTLLMQEAILWAHGKGILMTPAREKNLRTLILGNEEHKSDYLDIVPGVAHYARETHGIEIRRDYLGEMVIIPPAVGISGDRCIAYLEKLIDKSFDEGKPIDIVCINPVLSFLGGNASDQEVVSKFLRQGLDELVKRPGKEVAALLIHHTAKPLRDGGKRPLHEAQYDVFGSVEFANGCRSIISIVRHPKAERGVFRAIAAKRDFGWREEKEEGSWTVTNEKIIAHAPNIVATIEGGNLTAETRLRYWRELEGEELEALEANQEKQTKDEREAEAIERYTDTIAEYFEPGIVMSHRELETKCRSVLEIKAGKQKDTVRKIVKRLGERYGIAHENKGRGRFFYLGREEDLKAYFAEMKARESEEKERLKASKAKKPSRRKKTGKKGSTEGLN